MNAGMSRLLFTRLATAAGTLLFVAAAVFVTTTMLPGDVAQEILGQSATPEAVAALRHRLGLDRPPVERFLSWLGGLLVGDPGLSLVNGLPVATLIGGRLSNATRDLPVVQACALIFCAGYLLLVMLADIAAILSNPRLRHR